MKIKKSTTGKAALLLAAQVLAIAAVIGATAAFLVVHSAEIANIFNPSEVTCVVEEDITTTPGTKKDVKIENTGDIAAYIRAAVVVTWQDANGNVYGQKPKAETDYTIEFNTGAGSKWVLAADGFYYYTSEVAAGDTTATLINSCAPVADKSPESSYSLNVEIVASAIQSKPDRVVEEAWSNDKVTITANSGTLTVTPKKTNQGGGN